MGQTGLIRWVVTLFAMVAMLAGAVAAQEKVSIKGEVTRIDLKTSTVVVTTYDKRDVTITIEDEMTLKKLREGKIVEGDAVNVKYIVREGKNVSTYFRKPAGC
jgi:predicted lipid-binding transport protein (Tim44 family)